MSSFETGSDVMSFYDFIRLLGISGDIARELLPDGFLANLKTVSFRIKTSLHGAWMDAQHPAIPVLLAFCVPRQRNKTLNGKGKDVGQPV